MSTRPDREVAAVECVDQDTKIPVIWVIATDYASYNVLKHPHAVQTRIPGIEVHSKNHKLTQLAHAQ